MKSPEDTPQLQFLQGFCTGGKDYRGIEYQDLYLSDYNHDKVRELPNVSPKRWVLGLDLKLWPGSGSGTIVIAGEYFNVSYAWGGRDKPQFKGWTTGDRTSYTVRLEGEGVQEAIQKLREAIIKDESGSLQYGIKFRDQEAKKGIKSCKEGEAKVRESIESILNHRNSKNDSPEFKKAYNRLKAVLRKVPMAERLADYRKAWRANKIIMLTYDMKRIETDMLP